jgi:hypothetical protein
MDNDLENFQVKPAAMVLLQDLVEAFQSKLLSAELSAVEYRRKWIQAKEKVKYLDSEIELRERALKNQRQSIDNYQKEAEAAKRTIAEIEAKLAQTRTVGDYESVLKAITPERDPGRGGGREKYAHDESKGNANGVLKETEQRFARNFANYLDSLGMGGDKIATATLSPHGFGELLEQFILSVPSKPAQL